ncbi:hypothetical protein C4564_00400 [Candidatus Microgenomates bacterium]|nr:MAG: hypothetical protein C4564_00400 [Candidatus Microgenomates bacterium]
MPIEIYTHIEPASLRDEYKLFKERTGFTRAMGIIGSSNPKDLTDKSLWLEQGLIALRKNIGNFAVISGGTEGGIPEVAIEVASKIGLPAIGVYPEAGRKYALLNRLDFPVCVPQNSLSDVTWGSETSVLVGLSDAFIVLGGSWGTLAEFSMAMKQNDSRYRKQLPLKPVVVVADEGTLNGFSSIIECFNPPPGSVFILSNPEQMSNVVAGALLSQTT